MDITQVKDKTRTVKAFNDLLDALRIEYPEEAWTGREQDAVNVLISIEKVLKWLRLDIDDNGAIKVAE